MKEEKFGPNTDSWEKLKVRVFINSIKLASGNPGMIKRIEKEQGFKVEQIPELCNKYQIQANFTSSSSS